MPDQPGVFHDEIIREITKVSVQVDGINARLDRMNGSISDTVRGLGAIKIELTEHQVNCPVKTTVEELKHEIETGDHPGSRAVNLALERFNREEAARAAAAKTKSATIKDVLAWAKPFILAFIMTTLALIAIHFAELRKL